MIRKKTCLILGAGASVDFGYPSGKKLRDIICDEILGDANLIKCFRSIMKSETQIDEFKEAFRQSGRYSIDEFLQHRNEFSYIGKLSIAAALIPFEIKVNLFENKLTGQNWYKVLFQRMVEDCNCADDFAKNEISFLTLNYDRTLEEFLFHSVHNSFGIEHEKVISILSKIKILHLHGILGRPCCQESDIYSEVVNGTYAAERGILSDNVYYRDYLPNVTESTLKNSIRELKIVHDAQNEELFAEAVKIINESTRVYFLGTGFNKETLQRLQARKITNQPFIRCTAYGMQEIEISRAKSCFADNRSVAFKDSTIEDFFKCHADLS